MAGNSKPLLWSAVIIVIVAALDQITKLWAVDYLAGRPTVQVLGDFLRFSLVYNVGGALGTNLGAPSYYLIIALLIIPVLLYFLYHYRANRPFAYAMAFICGGALGNIIDRIRLGRVVDFLDVDFFNIHIGSFYLDRWWTFNIADAAISCALVFLLIRILFFSHAMAPSHPVPPMSDLNSGTGPDSDIDSRNSIPSA